MDTKLLSMTDQLRICNILNRQEHVPLEDEGAGRNFCCRIYSRIEGVEGRGKGGIDVRVQEVGVLLILLYLSVSEDGRKELAESKMHSLYDRVCLWMFDCRCDVLNSHVLK